MLTQREYQLAILQLASTTPEYASVRDASATALSNIYNDTLGLIEMTEGMKDDIEDGLVEWLTATLPPIDDTYEWTFNRTTQAIGLTEIES